MTTCDSAIQTVLSCGRDALAVSDLEAEGPAAIGRIYAAALDTERRPTCGRVRDVRAGARLGAAARRRTPREPDLAGRSRLRHGRGSRRNREPQRIRIGVSLMAPHARHPDHNHGPEEVYTVLSPGGFQHGGSGWFEPGIGGILPNAPDIRHAMASGAAPLFAIWLPWRGPAA